MRRERGPGFAEARTLLDDIAREIRAAESKKAEGKKTEVAIVPDTKKGGGTPPPDWPATKEGKDALTYVLIPGGTFQMGCVEGDAKCEKAEVKPARKVSVDRFYLGKTEVTAEAFRRFFTASDGSAGRDGIRIWRGLTTFLLAWGCCTPETGRRI